MREQEKYELLLVNHVISLGYGALKLFRIKIRLISEEYFQAMNHVLFVVEEYHHPYFDWVGDYEGVPLIKCSAYHLKTLSLESLMQSFVKSMTCEVSMAEEARICNEFKTECPLPF